MFVMDLFVFIRRSSHRFLLGHMISSIPTRKIQPAMLKWIRVFSGVWDLISINKLFSVCSAIISIPIHSLCNRPHRRGSCPVHRNGIQAHHCMNHLFTHRNRWWVNSVLHTRRPVEQQNDRSPMSAIAQRVRRPSRCLFDEFSVFVSPCSEPIVQWSTTSSDQVGIFYTRSLDDTRSVQSSSVVIHQTITDDTRLGHDGIDLRNTTAGSTTAIGRFHHGFCWVNRPCFSLLPLISSVYNRLDAPWKSLFYWKNIPIVRVC